MTSPYFNEQRINCVYSRFCKFLLLRGASQFIDEETPGHDKFVDEDDYGKTPEHMGKYSAIAKYKEDAAKEGSVSFIP